MSDSSDSDETPLRYWARRILPWLAIFFVLYVVLTQLAPGSRLATGVESPPVSVALADGGHFDLASHRGTAVLLNFWATWCPPCRAEAPVLARAHDRLQREGGGQVVGLSMDTHPLAHVAARAGQLGMRYPIAMATPRIARDFQVDTLPTSYLVDAEGRIVWSYVGGVSDGQIEDALELLAR